MLGWKGRKVKEKTFTATGEVVVADGGHSLSGRHSAKPRTEEKN